MEDLLIKLITILCLVLAGGGFIVYFIYRTFRNEIDVTSEEEKDIIDLNNEYHGGKN